MFYNLAQHKRYPRVLHQHSKNEASLLKLSKGTRQHLFLSHVWKTGQDQARVIKQLLKEVLPGIRVFLDVDDLTDVSLLESEIDASCKVLVFVSSGYFESKNCLRELVRAIELEDEEEAERAIRRSKLEASRRASRSSMRRVSRQSSTERALIAAEEEHADDMTARLFFVCESEQIHGKLTESQALQELERAYRKGKELWKKHLKDEEQRKARGFFGTAGGLADSSSWAEWPLPYRDTPQDREAFEHIRDVVRRKMRVGILWHRIKDFQQLTLVEVAEHLIEAIPGDPPFIPGGPLDEKVPLPTHPPADGFHIYVSPYNAGALDFVYDELRHRFKGELKIAYSQDAIREYLEADALAHLERERGFYGDGGDDAGLGRKSFFHGGGRKSVFGGGLGGGRMSVFGGGRMSVFGGGPVGDGGGGTVGWKALGLAARLAGSGFSGPSHDPKQTADTRGTLQQTGLSHGSSKSVLLEKQAQHARGVIGGQRHSSAAGGSRKSLFPGEVAPRSSMALLNDAVATVTGVPVAERQQSSGACIFLLYLDARTWTSENSHDLRAEIEAQLAAVKGKEGVQPSILLLHERDERHHQAVDFETFFSTTPPELIKTGLYHAMAEPLYAGQHRRRSLRKAAERLADLLNDPSTFTDDSRWSQVSAI